MFYQMITNARNRWLASPECTVKELIAYIENAGQMRDAQIDAIKTYLFLKIGCDCQLLSRLFSKGHFNTLDLRTVELSASTRTYLEEHPEAAALLEYACLKNDAGEQVAPKLEEQIRKAPDSIDYEKFFKEAFYNVSYSDYLFSLPMGAGKTYLMATFIYLDLYFAMNEPQNPAFAHNFIILAPSGLKSSVVPSLKTIQKFDPAWVIPEPAASNIKRMLFFEVLDQSKTASKSNKTKNPNVQKIASHQPLNELFGLVAVTNAEKVILDRIQEKNGQITLSEDSDDEKDRQANELRNLIGKLPALAIFIDEVHHAVRDEIKLRAVVNRWNRPFDFGAVNFAHFSFRSRSNVTNVVGFSGTPYLEKAEKIAVTDKLTVATSEITNTVYYYPLVDSVGNFLKRPVVKIADIADSGRIIEKGVREFLNTYTDTVYQDGTTAKLGIYCSTIEKLEELVYPLVFQIVREYGLPAGCILKFHKGNKQYPQPADSQMQFDTLDNPISKIRIVLLVQIGKEGWDCRSLTGVILSQEGDCHKNMVLQTSCRCLRQVDRGRPETALIYLNSANGDKLTAQLQRQQHISLNEFVNGGSGKVILNCYNRTGYLKLPKVDFYQLRVRYEDTVEKTAVPAEDILHSVDRTETDKGIVRTTDFSMQPVSIEIDDKEHGTEQTTFFSWLYQIIKGSFGTLKMEDLIPYHNSLEQVYHKITFEKDSSRYYSFQYDQAKIAANIRKAFCDKRSFQTTEELIPEEASLLNIANFTPTIQVRDTNDYFPEQDTVEKIHLDDQSKLKLDKNMQKMMELAEQTGQTQVLEMLRAQTISHPQKDLSFHYLPYHTDSNFEQVFLRDVLPLREVEQLGLEVYYNGDRAMTEFKIKCYKSAGNGWNYIGMYTPDFLIIQRKEWKIHKALIVETKGKLYANDPMFKEKQAFMESEFLRQNNAAFGYERFEYLYLEDATPDKERIIRTHEKICEFFGG